LAHQEIESNLRKKREKIVRERKGEISIKLTIAVPAEEFQRKRVRVIDDGTYCECCERAQSITAQRFGQNKASIVPNREQRVDHRQRRGSWERSD
jgi:hypothetical protein